MDDRPTVRRTDGRMARLQEWNERTNDDGHDRIYTAELAYCTPLSHSQMPFGQLAHSSSFEYVEDKDIFDFRKLSLKGFILAWRNSLPVRNRVSEHQILVSSV